MKNLFMELVEKLVTRMFALGGVSLESPFPKITWHEAMDTMGSDRPDTRFDLRFTDATDIFGETSYGIFKTILDKGGVIKGINIRGQSSKLSKNVLQNEYAKKIVPSFGAKGMTWMRVAEGTIESNIVQFFSEEEKKEIIERFRAEDGDVIILIADISWNTVVSVLGQLRLHLAKRLDLINEDVYCPVWIVEFPLFSLTGRRITSNHHPFTAPDRTDFDPENREDLLTLKSRAYDLVVNGEELAVAALEFTREVFKKRFSRF